MKLIDVVCAVFPNGDTLWFEADKGKDYLSCVVAAWREQHPEYINIPATMGAVEIRMPRERFDAIISTNCFNWPEG